MSDFDANIKKRIPLSTVDESMNKPSGTHTSLLYAASTVGVDQDKNATKERLKARFRQRRAEQEKSQEKKETTILPANPAKQKKKLSVSFQQHTLPSDPPQQKKLSGSVQQRLQFFERSLQAVERK